MKTLAEAEAYLADHTNNWDNAQAIAEGWAIFNLGDNLGCGIEKLDEEAIFDSDDEAELFIQMKAEDGSEYHAQALRLHKACNAIRFHTWGPEWVDSRIGPDNV